VVDIQLVDILLVDILLVDIPLENMLPEEILMLLEVMLETLIPLPLTLLAIDHNIMLMMVDIPLEIKVKLLLILLQIINQLNIPLLILLDHKPSPIKPEDQTIITLKVKMLSTLMMEITKVMYNKQLNMLEVDQELKTIDYKILKSLILYWISILKHLSNIIIIL